MLPDARDPNFQTADISILRQQAFWNCVKMTVILSEMSGLSYFAIQIQSWFFKTQSKVNYSSKHFSNA